MISENEISIQVEPENQNDNDPCTCLLSSPLPRPFTASLRFPYRSHVVDSLFSVSLNPDILNLLITYTPTYPDELPEISIEVSSGDLSDEEETFLLDGLRESAEESLGMVRSFSLSPLSLFSLMSSRE